MEKKEYVEKCPVCETGRIRYFIKLDFDCIEIEKTCGCPLRLSSNSLSMFLNQLIPISNKFGKAKYFDPIAIPSGKSTRIKRMIRNYLDNKYPCIFKLPDKIVEFCPARREYMMKPETLQGYCNICPHRNKYLKLLDIKQRSMTGEFTLKPSQKEIDTFIQF